MGYFSSGSEGADYEYWYCDNCVHQGPIDGPGCPVFGLHSFWNYDQLKDTPEAKVMEEALSSFIPRSEDRMRNEQCKMFHRKPEGEQIAIEMFNNLDDAYEALDKEE